MITNYLAYGAATFTAYCIYCLSMRIDYPENGYFEEDEYFASEPVITKIGDEHTSLPIRKINRVRKMDKKSIRSWSSEDAKEIRRLANKRENHNRSKYRMAKMAA